jgi:predicted HicB family RNase H-like nuclease
VTYINPFDPATYSITIRKQSIDGKLYFVGTATEFPDVVVFEDTQEDAYREVIQVIESLKILSDENNNNFPSPAPLAEEYSGRVTLRLSKSLHQKAAQFSVTEGVSLNQYFVTIIVEAVGGKNTMLSASTSTYQAILPLMKTELKRSEAIHK